MKHFIRFPKAEGVYSKQAHADFPEGTYEREFGKNGFFGPATHIHHKHKPTGWTEFEGPLKPRAFDTTQMDAHSEGPWRSKMLLFNSSVQFRVWQFKKGKMEHLFRNGDGDDLLFVHAGMGHLYCDLGHMEFSEGDYIMFPRGSMWRLEAEEDLKVLLIEATNDHYMLPEKGVVGPHAIFDPACLETPKIDDLFKAQQTEDPWKVIVKKQNLISTISYPFNPLDCVGWHGDNVPVKINWRDIRPLMSARYHVPPSAHTTFLASRFVICTFCPRPIESDPGALKVPFFHNNDDFDEVIFYHAGNFFSRDNIDVGMVTWHPCGFTHGPHPKAFQAGEKSAKKETNEVALMIDARDPLEISTDAQQTENSEYVNSWREDK